MATALKMAAICMLILMTTGQLMAAAAGASAPVAQADAAPTARRLLEADHERPASDDSESEKAMAMMLLRLLQKKAGSCVCTFHTLWCCDDSQKKTMMSLQLLQKTGSCPCTLGSLWCC